MGGKASRLPRAQVVEALHRGMADAVADFTTWTDGEFLGAWGVESVMTTACAKRLKAAATAIGSKSALTLEQTFQGIVWHSGRRTPRGRPTEAELRIAGRQTGRIDLVLWNADATPRAMIEIKRNAGVEGLVADAVRVMDFIRCAGRAYRGSVRYGLVATLISGPAGRGQAHVTAKARKRIERLAYKAEQRDMAFECHGPVWLGELDTWDREVAATYVFVFRPRRDPS